MLGANDYAEVNGDWVWISAVLELVAALPELPQTCCRGSRSSPTQRARREGLETPLRARESATWGAAPPNVTDNGVAMEVLHRLCDVSCPLDSASHVCDNGNRVTYGRDAGIIHNLQIGAEVPLYRHGAV